MKLPKGLIIILIIAGAIFLIWWMATRRRVKGGLFVRYQFFRQMDSPGSDIVHLPEYEGNVSALKEACNKIPECVAFNTAGYLKGSVDPNNLKEYSGYPDWAGIYIRRKILR